MLIDIKLPKINKETIESLLPHRDPMLLIDELVNIIPKVSATGVLNVTYDKFFLNGHFPGQPVMPGVLIIESFGQAAAALAAYSVDRKEIDNKLVFLMTVKNAKFRSPVIPNCKLFLNVKVDKILGRVWRYKGEAFVNEKRTADAEWMATIVDRK